VSTEADSYDYRLREAALAWLDERTRHGLENVSHVELSQFAFEGRRVPLIDPQRGIRKPASLDAALSLRTTFTPPNQIPPYEDAEGADGLLRYKYRGDDGRHPDNVALRHAMEQVRPLVWAGATLLVPKARNARPDPERLEERYEEFRAAG